MCREIVERGGDRRGQAEPAPLLDLAGEGGNSGFAITLQGQHPERVGALKQCVVGEPGEVGV